MIDLPPAYESIRENPLQNMQYNEQTISYADALNHVLNNNDHNLLSYFQQLQTIRMDEIFTLPTWNSFQITEKWIIFIREWKKELRVIHAENKNNARIKINSLVYHPDGFLLWISWIKRWICIKQDDQILPRKEVIPIFEAIGNNNTYKTSKNNADWTINKTILVVTLDD